MKYLKKFNESNESWLRYEQKKKMESIDSLCKRLKINNYKINNDLSVDVYEDVRISNLGLTELPFKFNTIKGDFNCSFNKLTSLKNCPKEVIGSFNCMKNKIRDLEYFPEHISKNIILSSNHLVNLKGIQDVVSGNIDCSSNFITSLLGCPSVIDGNLISISTNLKSLLHSPKSVRYMNLNNNKILSFDGFPKNINGFKVADSPIDIFLYLVENSDNFGDKIELFNDYGIIRVDGDKAFLDLELLNNWLDDIGEKMTSQLLEQIKKYYIVDEVSKEV